MKTKIISQSLIEQLLQRVASDARQRTNHNLHNHYSDPVQRFLNVIDNSSYIRPHYHNQAGLCEGFVIIQGELSVLQFDDDGYVREKTLLAADGPNFGIELDATKPHSIVARSRHVVVFEYKPGPYLAENDKAFPDWAPEENDRVVHQYLNWMRSAQCGQCYSDETNID